MYGQNKMGNRMYRTHTARYAAEAARLRRNQANSSLSTPEPNIKLIQSTLYSTSTPGILLSFASFPKTELPEQIQSGLAIHKSSVSLSPSSPSTLSFRTQTDCPASVTIFFFAKEIIDGKTKSLFFSLNPKGPKSLKVQIEKGEQEVYMKCDFQLEDFTEDELNFADRCTFPLIILMKSEDEMLLSYFKFENKGLVKVRENYTKGDKSYEVKDVFEFLGEQCVVCAEKEPEVMAYGCGHVSSCKECFANIWKGNRRCPLCRSYIFGWCNKFG